MQIKEKTYILITVTYSDFVLSGPEGVRSVIGRNIFMKTEERVEQLLIPIIEEESKEIPYEVVDVEYVKEGSDWYLRAYIDKEGGITVDDCERISRALEAQLDKDDFIKDAYILEVSSPGLTRALKKDRDYDRNIDKPVEVHVFKALEFEIPGKLDKNKKPKTEKIKVFIGDLKAYSASDVTLDIGEDKEELVTIERNNISTIKQYFEW